MPTSATPKSEVATLPAAGASHRVLVCLPPLEGDAQEVVAAHIRESFGGQHVDVAGLPAEFAGEGIAPLDYVAPRSSLGWVLAAHDYAAAAGVADREQPPAVLLLGSDASTLPAATMHAMVDAIRDGADLALPRYPVNAHDALVTSALLYPLTRALFNIDIRFPLPVDAALSPRMLQRLASAATRIPASQNTDVLVWAVAEASVAGFRVQQCDSSERHLPAPPEMDLNSLLGAVLGSLFADIEAKATFWQRAQRLPAQQSPAPVPQLADAAEADLGEVQSMLENFRLASSNLGEIWSLVLPPQSLLALKKLAAMPAENFRFEHGLWARTVYDFALAFHGRSLNRGHLLGAMTPLYLAWVASHIRASCGDAEQSRRLIDAGAQAFEREKPYFVARWRWPDRFNP